MAKKKAKITHVRLPIHQRLKSYFINSWVYLLVVINLIIFIWLMLPPQRQLVYHNQGSLQSTELSLSCFIPFLKETTFLLRRTCLQNDLSLDLEDEIAHLLACQSEDQSSNYALWKPPNEFFHFLPINIAPGDHKQIISFSLYGISSRYYRNIIKIIRRYKELLPGWVPRFWLASDIPFPIINRLLYEDVEIVMVFQRQPEHGNVTRIPGHHGMFWRFFIADDESVDRYIVRDTDSMPIKREINAIDQWIKEKTIFHVLRDNKYHSIEILGGMWGGRVDKAIFSPSKEYEKALKSGWSCLDGKNIDQSFLKRYLWPIARHQMTCHTAYKWSFVDSRGCKSFPSRREGDEFIGAVIDY